MGNKPFYPPVFLKMKQNETGNYQARSAWEALEYLDRFWPAPRTNEYRRAKAMCRSALDNLVSAESARLYVIAAAERAGILERGWRIGPAPGEIGQRPGVNPAAPPASLGV